MDDQLMTARQRDKQEAVITFPSWKFLSLHFFSFYILVPQEPVEREMENEENFQNIPVTIDCLLKQVPEGMSLRTQSMVEREVSVITYWFHRIRKRRLEPCGTINRPILQESLKGRLVPRFFPFPFPIVGTR